MFFPWTLHMPVISCNHHRLQWKSFKDCRMQTLLIIGWKNQKSIQSKKTVRTTRPSQLPQLLSVPTKDPACFFDTFNFKSKKWIKDLTWSAKVQGWWFVYLWLKMIKVLLVVHLHGSHIISYNHHIITLFRNLHFYISMNQIFGELTTVSQALAPQLHERSALGHAVPHQRPQRFQVSHFIWQTNTVKERRNKSTKVSY